MNFQQMKIDNRDKVNKSNINVPYLNISTCKTTTEEDACLRKRPKYNIKKKINLKEIIPQIERVLNNFSGVEANKL